MGKKIQKIDFPSMVKNRKLPILTLDARWHELFPEERKNAKIKALETKVNNLLKNQGKLVNDIKDMKRLKKNLLNDIVNNMEISNDHHGKAREKKLNQNKQFINELNERIDKAEDELADIPYKIKEANEELTIESLKLFYEMYHKNDEEIKKISDWIDSMRDELKKKIIEKQEIEERRTLIYTYMHDILGADIMSGFDISLNQENKE